MGVHGLHRVVGPLDEVEAHAERRAPLLQLEANAQAGFTCFGKDAEHVRPLRRPAVLQGRQGIDEPRHASAAIERAEEDAAPFDGDDQHRRRDDVLGVAVPQTRFSSSTT